MLLHCSLVILGLCRGGSGYAGCEGGVLIIKCQLAVGKHAEELTPACLYGKHWLVSRFYHADRMPNSCRLEELIIGYVF